MTATLRVLAYHRIGAPGDRPDLHPSTLSATPAEFERQVRHLARRYDVVELDRVIDALRDGRPLPPRPVLLTFDDAYVDFREVAWPILREHRLPATLFVPTRYPASPERRFWWDRLHRALSGSTEERVSEAVRRHLPPAAADPEAPADDGVGARLKALPHAEAMDRVDRLCRALGEPAVEEGEERAVLGWSEIRRLAEDGVAVGSHTRRHPLLTRLPPEEARREIVGSRKDLARELGRAPRAFAYPAGYHDDTLAGLVREAGYEIAFTMVDGHNRIPGADPFRLRRTGVTRRTRLPVLALRLQPWFGPVDRWRHRREIGRQVG